MKILWNLLYQYNNIYKRKKKVQTKDGKNKKIKRQNASPKWHYRWTMKNVVWTVQKHCMGIGAFRYLYIYKHECAKFGFVNLCTVATMPKFFF